MSPRDQMDPYRVLGVARDASEDDIRRAYRKLARKYHPDVNPGDLAAEDKFKDLSAAYEVLGDAAKRKAYDEFGAESFASGFDPDKARAYRQWRDGRTRTNHPFEREVADFDLGDLSDLFGGRFGGAGRRRGNGRTRSGAQRGRDVRVTAELDFKTALQGTEIEIGVPIERECGACAGAGVKPGAGHKCAACAGSGQRAVAQGPLRMMATCDVCGGEGVSGPACDRCGGTGTESAVRTTRIRIPPGADDGDTLRIAGKGAPGRNGGSPGDLIILTRVAAHPVVSRDGLDLHMRLPLTLEEAYSGASVEVPTFTGAVSLKVPAQSQPGSKLRLRGKGVERGGKRGDLIVELDVVFPARHDPQLADALRAASTLYDQPVRKDLSL